MGWLRSVGSIVWGYAATVAVVLPVFTLAERFAPHVHESMAGLLGLALAAVVGGVVGGWVAGIMGWPHAVGHAAALGVVSCALGLVVAATANRSAGAVDPAWFRWGLPVLALPAGVAGGVMARRYMARRLKGRRCVGADASGVELNDA